MVAEAWRFQHHYYSRFETVAVLPDGSLVVAGRESNSESGDEDFVAFKLNSSDGSILWKWKEGSDEDDHITAAATTADGSVILGGYTYGSWIYPNPRINTTDLAIIKLDSDKEELWKIQNGTTGFDYITAVSVGPDDSIYLAGTYDSDFLVLKLDTSGSVLWQWVGDSGSIDVARGIGVTKEGDFAVLAGFTYGDWSGISAGNADIAAAKLTSDGEEVWRWQDGTTDMDIVNSLVIMEDDSVLMAGYTYGNFGALNLGLFDFLAIHMDANGSLIWVWQDGTESSDILLDIAISESGRIVIGGGSYGNWSAVNVGDYDFAAVELILSAGPNQSQEIWRWQDGTPSSDFITGMALVSNDSLVVVGPTEGSYGREFVENNDSEIGINDSQAVAVMLDTSSSEPTPTPTPTPISTARSPQESGMVIIIVAVGSIATLLVAFLTCFVCLRRRRGTRRSSKNEGALVATDGVVPVATDVFVSANLSSEPNPGPSSRVRMTSSGKITRVETLGAEVLQDDRVHPDRDQILPIDSHPAVFPKLEGHPPSGTSSISSISGDTATRNYELKPALGRDLTQLVRQGGKRSFGDPSGDSQTTPQQLSPIPGTLSNPKHQATGPVLPAVTPLIGATIENCTGGGSREDRPGTSESAFDDGSKILESSGAQSVPVQAIARSMLAAVERLTEHSSVPGVSEAATLLSMFVRLVVDSNDTAPASERRLRWCWSIMTLLGRTNKFLGEQSEQTHVEATGYLLDDVRESIEDLVQLLQSYQCTKGVSKVVMSSTFRRRQEDAEVAINMAVNRLQMGLQIQSGNKLYQLAQDFKEGLDLQRLNAEPSSKVSLSDNVKEALAASRKQRRARRLEQLEISEENVTLTDEVLGKGGFGTVYVANYNGKDAAAKVIEVEHDFGASGYPTDSDGTHEGEPRGKGPGRHNIKRRAFLRELEAMSRLRSPHIVHVYGAITSRKDRLVLVMELMSGGDLRAFLKSSRDPLPEEKIRSIVADVCAGMAFLHEKLTVHGDLKSENILLDEHGRAKIADFGTTQWAQNTASTGLATYTKRGHGIHLSLPWAAPELLDGDGTSFKTDVYSFGIVVWEVLTRELPWAGQVNSRQIFVKVVLKGERPEIPADTPSDLADMVRACWTTESEERPAFASLKNSVKFDGWDEI